MTQTPNKDTRLCAVYTIHVEGHLDPSWSDWLDGVVITPLENGESLISGRVADQSALHGLLAKIRDLNLTLISVIRELGMD